MEAVNRPTEATSVGAQRRRRRRERSRWRRPLFLVLIVGIGLVVIALGLTGLAYLKLRRARSGLQARRGPEAPSRARGGARRFPTRGGPLVLPMADASVDTRPLRAALPGLRTGLARIGEARQLLTEVDRSVVPEVAAAGRELSDRLDQASRQLTSATGAMALVQGIFAPGARRYLLALE